MKGAFSRWWWVIAFVAFAVLAAMAVWMGALNQDEGWYLYAANLVREGARPYADFAFTQGPVMPYVYAHFVWVWETWGLLGARVFTLSVGLAGVALFAVAAMAAVPRERRREAAFTVFLLLAANLYHLYYLAIPKTYALASLYVAAGLAALALAPLPRLRRFRRPLCVLAGASFGLAAGVRVSLAAAPAAVTLMLFAGFRRDRWDFLWFGFGAFAGVFAVYVPSLFDSGAVAGLVEAQRYHAARGGFDPVWTAGSVSRLIRWYLPLFIVLGLGVWFRRGAARTEGDRVGALALGAFLAVAVLQLVAPFPYEDYQVPVMGLLAVYATIGFLKGGEGVARRLLVLGLALASSFASPLIEKWAVNGQDRFWPLKKAEFELPQLRRVAREIEALDPGGRLLLTQDLYLAIETRRRVPRGLEMGPFSILSDSEWVALLELDASPVAALSGYTFAINPPKCDERPIEDQLRYWNLLKRRYRLRHREEAFGQGATPLMVLTLKPVTGDGGR